MTYVLWTNSLRDRIGNADLTESARATMATADAVQRFEDKGARFMGLACAFVLTAEHLDIPIQDMITFAKNCINDADGKRPEFQAVSNYIEKEIFN